ncbi:hypothetical protein [Caloramator australicus]|uniref:Uncharacterized protein n=1 Tax=Caloramator australicus RC3 TaxID=857293 RepID=I7KUC1_9CLOT|nr:hypothetical protein [Caloramator australicus]CCJ33493.1 hypothetical protein CAAU_1409 [Caloramator australicus RC3]
MEMQRFLGYPLKYLEEFLNSKNVPFTVKYVLAPNGKKLGDEVRIIKIDEADTITIYASYF